MLGSTSSKVRSSRKVTPRQQAARRLSARVKARATQFEERNTFRKTFAAFFESLRDTFAPGRICVASDRAYEVHEEGSWRRRHDLLVKNGKIVGRS
jgi:hypothetical protein